MNTIISSVIQAKIPTSNNYVAYVYGSSANNEPLGRDIDVMAVSADFKKTELISFLIELHGTVRACNFYCITEQMFLADACYLAYGGYYSHKLSVSFGVLSKLGTAIDAAQLFWEYEAKRNNINDARLSARTIIRETHRRIFQQTPTFAAPLTAYINSPDRIIKLESFVNLIARSQNISHQDAKSRSERSIYKRNSRRAFYLYWREYGKYKDDGVLWGRRTLAKIAKCLAKIDHAAVISYLGEMQHD